MKHLNLRIFLLVLIFLICSSTQKKCVTQNGKDGTCIEIKNCWVFEGDMQIHKYSLDDLKTCSKKTNKICCPNRNKSNDDVNQQQFSTTSEILTRKSTKRHKNKHLNASALIKNKNKSLNRTNIDPSYPVEQNETLLDEDRILFPYGVNQYQTTFTGKNGSEVQKRNVTIGSQKGKANQSISNNTVVNGTRSTSKQPYSNCKYLPDELKNTECFQTGSNRNRTKTTSASILETTTPLLYFENRTAEQTLAVNSHKSENKLATIIFGNKQHNQRNKTSKGNFDNNLGHEITRKNITETILGSSTTKQPLINMKNNSNDEIEESLIQSTTLTTLTSFTERTKTKEVRKTFTITSTSTKSPTTVKPMRKSEQKCAEYGLSTIQKIRVMGLIGHKPREVTVDKCRHKAIPLVVGGREAMPYEFPHQALLGYDFNDQTIFKCGGSLISRNFILTAAHCIYDFELGAVKVVELGAFNQFEDTDKTVIRNVIEHIEHPDFDRLNLIDDIGLLKLDDFVPLNEFINPACLPIEQTKNTHAVAIGFGATETSLRSKRLMKVVLEKFEPWYPQRIRNHTYVDKFIFYGHRTQRRDTCSGDSGSPLQVSNDMNVKCSYTQVGIVSYGPNECGIPEVPAVYVNVFYYKDWIERYIWVDEDRLEQENDP